METIIAQLFAARDIAHLLHLRVRSFSAHLALNDLYDGLLDSADTITEAYQGKYGIINIPNPIFTFNDNDPIIFIKELAQWANNSRVSISPNDTHILNEWDSLVGIIYKAKYKLENLT